MKRRRRKTKTPEQKAAIRERRIMLRYEVQRVCGRKAVDQAKRSARQELYDRIAASRIYAEEGRGYAEFTNEDLRKIIAKKNRQQNNYRNGHVYHLYLETGRTSGEEVYQTIYKVYCDLFMSALAVPIERSGIMEGRPESEQKAIADIFEAYANEVVPPAKSRTFSVGSLIRYLRENPFYKDFRALNAEREILNEIPDDITELFPRARELRRHFILHSGDTNSGKTHDAIEEMRAAATGVYLAPLRLLALEIQERLLGEGVICSLLTGEEEDLVPSSTHMSSTVEMLDMDAHYEVCVIDEAQMIDDEQRGWAWTKAVLGACADRIHVCMSENALGLIIKLIKACGDTYEVIKHVRNTPLVFEEEEFQFPESIQEHDALIVFSRRKVLWVAAELERSGISASVIYGSLPYSVRKNEINKFVTGKTDVVVSTDAIGMGMNLPVRRIVFLESYKFDGKGSRLLRGPEVKQIAGRAGRRGLYETGYVTAYYDADMIRYELEEPYDPINKARIQMPERLLDLDMTLSETIYSWNNIANDELYKKADVSIMLKKCEAMEELDGLSKQEMWHFALIPFDERNKILWKLWKRLIYDYYNMEPLTIEQVHADLSEGKVLADLETDYKILDLYFSFSRAINFNENDFRYNIGLMKEIISDRIIKELRNISGERKRCKACGRPLVWDSRHDLCRACARKAAAAYEGGRGRRR